MPFNIWCGGCTRHIARGVRFNAEKKQIGSYLSTPILSFRMKCPSCSQWIEIHTDPKNAEYQVVSGGKRKAEAWDAASNEVKAAKTKEEAEKLIYNPFYKIEHDFKDEQQAKEALPKLQQMMVANEQVWRGDFDSSRAARKRLREEKVELEQKQKELDSLQKRLGASDLALLPEEDADIQKATTQEFKKVDTATKRISEVKSSSIFKQNNTTPLQRILGKSKASGSVVSQLQLGSNVHNKRK